MNIQQFSRVSHVNYGCLSAPESEVDIIARPGEKFKDPADWHLFPEKIKATDYIYEIGPWSYGTAEEVIKFYEGQLMCEFSKEKDRHIFRFRPWADVHFLDGSKQTIYFNNEDEVSRFSNHMKTHVGLDKHLVVDCGEFVGVSEINPFDEIDWVKNS